MILRDIINIISKNKINSYFMDKRIYLYLPFLYYFYLYFQVYSNTENICKGLNYLFNLNCKILV